MAKSYPHKQTLFIAVICILTVSGTVVFVNWQKSPVSMDQDEASAVIASNAPTNDIATTSTDWEKQFFVAATTTPKASTAEKDSVADDTNLTVTDRLGRDFFTQYMSIKEDGLITGDQATQDIVNGTLDQAIQSAPQPAHYTLSDIHVSADTSDTAIHSYGNLVASAFIEYIPQTNPTDIVSASLENQDPNALADLDPIVAGYKKVLVTLLNTKVPQSLAQDHLALVNGVSLMLYVTQGFEQAQKDPMQSMIALSSYSGAQDAMNSALVGIKTYFDASGISFSANEPGISFETLSQPS